MKRHIALQSLSREHHYGLLLCWKIRTGLSKEIATQRIKEYADWFYSNHVVLHFEVEEKHVFPIIGDEHPLVKKALEQHGTLRKLFLKEFTSKTNLEQLADTLDDHIRFEERELFLKIQELATPTQLQNLVEAHSEIPFDENTKDTFWN